MSVVSHTVSRRQVLRVVVVLAITGAVAGAACGAIAAVLSLAAHGQIRAVARPAAWPLLGLISGAAALVGSIAAPAFGWFALRSVPLGRAIGWTATGTIVGAVAGELVQRYVPYLYGITAPDAGAVVGFLVSGIWLRAVSSGARDSVREPYDER